MRATGFDKECARLNEFVRPGALRRFQQDILLSHGFTFRGTRVMASCFLQEEEVNREPEVGYRFILPDGPLWLVTQNVSRGSGLGIGFRPLSGDCFPVGDGKDLAGTEVLGRVAEKLDGVEARMPGHDGSPPTSTLVLVGHANFAHVIWNQLPGLLAARLGPPPEVFSSYEPLGPIEQLVPYLELRRWTGPELRSGDFSQDVTYVRPGSVIVTEETKDVVRRHVRAAASPWAVQLAARLRDLDAPVVWVSVRTDLRTAVNQEDFLDALLRVFDEEYPGVMFVLDGFSLPEDYGTNAAYDHLREGFQRRVNRNGELMARLLRRAPHLAERVVDLNGSRLVDVLHVAGVADYYVCHVGTLHHKVGWLNEVPGFLHFRPASEMASVLVPRWYHAGAENALLPDAVTIDEVDLVENEAATRSRNQDYAFHDPQALARRVVACSRQWLGPAAAPSPR